MKNRTLGLAIVSIGLLIGTSESGAGKPPRPGPEYDWVQQHTTPEGHYVPGRWVRKPSHPGARKPPLPSAEHPGVSPHPRPGAHWTPPPPAPHVYGQAGPVPPRTAAPYPYTFTPALPYIAAPLAGLYLFRNVRPFNDPYTYGYTPYSVPYGRYHHSPRTPYLRHRPVSPPPFKYPHGRADKPFTYRGRPVEPPHPPLHKYEVRKYDARPGKGSHAPTGKPHGSYRPGKRGGPGMKDDKHPGKKK